MSTFGWICAGVVAFWAITLVAFSMGWVRLMVVKEIRNDGSEE